MRYPLIVSIALMALAGCASTPESRDVAPASMPTAQVGTSMPVSRPRATGSAEDARRHMLRGSAAIEMAKSDSDLVMAEDEFRMASEIAPQMAEAWFNLGAVQTRLGRYREAIASYRQYLALAPNAEDAPKLRDELVKLEFRAEKQEQVKSREGIWLLYSPAYEHTRYGRGSADDPVPYRLSLNGSRIALHSYRHDGVRANVGFFGQDYTLQAVERSFILDVRGSSLSGTGRRAAFALDECTVPAEEMAVTGELDDSSGTITLRYREQKYVLDQRGSLLLGTTSCNGVNVSGTRDVTLKLRGPLPAGGIGVLLNFYEELEVANDPHSGFEAAAAGLKEDDVILAVDGVKVSGVGMSDQDIIRHLRGEPGSVVELTVRHEGARQPVTLRFRRGPLPDKNIDDPKLPWLH